MGLVRVRDRRWEDREWQELGELRRRKRDPGEVGHE
jgi:hypothetical protein